MCTWRCLVLASIEFLCFGVVPKNRQPLLAKLSGWQPLSLQCCIIMPSKVQYTAVHFGISYGKTNQWSPSFFVGCFCDVEIIRGLRIRRIRGGKINQRDSKLNSMSNPSGSQQ